MIVNIHLHRLKRRAARPKFLRFAELLFLIAGIAALGYAGYSYAARHIYQAYESRVFERAVAFHDVDHSARHDFSAEPPGSRARPSLIGKIAIPALGISAIVKEGVDDATLSLAAGHFPFTALPGGSGNVGIAAHRDSFFRNLKDVRRNDRITLTTLDGADVYRVVSFRIVNPSDVGVLAASPEERTLTLVTCYPFYFVGHAPKRFVVRANLIANASIIRGSLPATNYP